MHYAEQNGDYFEYEFHGTGIQFFTEVDPSQGDMDIYVDGEFKETVSAYRDGRLAQQKVYSISGLPDGQHTLKAVKKSGRFMLLDFLKVEIPNIIQPVSAIFDKAESAQADIEVTLLQEPESFSKIMNGSKELVMGTDYEVTGDRVTLKKSYLAEQPLGTLKLSFVFDGDYLNDIHYSTVDGDSFEYVFKGTGISMITPTGPQQGEVDIYTDGNLVQTVSTYSQGRKNQQEIYSISGMTSGVHTLKAVKKSGELMLTDQLKFTIAAGNGVPTNPTNPPGPSVPSNPGAPSTPVTQPPETPSEAPETGTGEEPSGNTDDQTMRHEAYINGYKDGLFKPNNKITRAEMATILAQVYDKSAVQSDVTFRDVDSSHWGAEAIAKVAKMGLMKGYKDGTFKPNQSLTRAEMASLAVSLNPDPATPGSGFSDIGSHWAKDAILRAQSLGILTGYRDGTFRPNAELTRAEAVVVINRALGRGPLTGVSQPKWKDVLPSHWAFGDIEEASADHVSKPAANGGEKWVE
ncbi:S-layer homology domain-containing protein [Paenibacillus xylanilyticus]|uniref:S-layer homology domain-containing protein n=1 Tax=Paenibacillus xylanilyticus TaxID=248903 RepID=UPI0039A072AC